jgi:hypothetical protein
VRRDRRRSASDMRGGCALGTIDPSMSWVEGSVLSDRGLVRAAVSPHRTPSPATIRWREARAMVHVLSAIALALFGIGLVLVFATKGTPLEVVGTGCVLASVLAVAVAAWLQGGPEL